MKQLIRNAKIIGTGSYTPEKIFTNEYLSTLVETNSDWIYKNVGINERRIAAVEGALRSGVAVATIIKSISFSVNPASAIALWEE